MRHELARTPEDIRSVLDTLQGVHEPTRKSYRTSGCGAFWLGILCPIALVWFVFNPDPWDVEWWYTVLTLFIGPVAAFSMLRTSMATFVIDDDHIECIAPLRAGWSVVRGEITRIEANVSPLLVALQIYSALRKNPYSLPLSKELSRKLMTTFPELRRLAGRATAEKTYEDYQRKAKNRLILILFGLFVVFITLMIVAIQYVHG